MLYISTRGNREAVTASKAILNGLAADGGLYVPESFPEKQDFMTYQGLDYQETAYRIMKLFLSDFTEEELRHCINSAYNDKFEKDTMVDIVEKSGIHYLELFHGKTLAFKDMALSILPHLMVTAAKKNGVKEKILILTATSGDTGKAALSGFSDVDGTAIVVFYPEGGVSAFQRKQMITEKGKNTHVVAIRGNFDDAQNGVKEIFLDEGFNRELKEKGVILSSANSINIGRLVPQIVYYVYSYMKLVERGSLAMGETLDVVVPTGNFGNILAAYYAKKLGLPIAKLISASNENKVLADFISTGEYNKNRAFSLTISPSMDILVSSNLERLIYALSGEDAALTKEYMTALKEKGSYQINEKMKAELADFLGYFATEEETLAAIKEEYENSGYVIDTHTAVAASIAKRYQKERGEKGNVLVASTASPFKFARSVMHALKPAVSLTESGVDEKEWELITELSKLSGVEVSANVTEPLAGKTRHSTVIDKEDMRAEVVKMA